MMVRGFVNAIHSALAFSDGGRRFIRRFVAPAQTRGIAELTAPSRPRWYWLLRKAASKSPGVEHDSSSGGTGFGKKRRYSKTRSSSFIGPR